MPEEFLALLEDVSQDHEVHWKSLLRVQRLLAWSDGSSHLAVPEALCAGCRDDGMDVAHNQLDFLEVGGGLDDGRHVVDVESI